MDPPTTVTEEQPNPHSQGQQSQELKDRRETLEKNIQDIRNECKRFCVGVQTGLNKDENLRLYKLFLTLRINQYELALLKLNTDPGCFLNKPPMGFQLDENANRTTQTWEMEAIAMLVKYKNAVIDHGAQKLQKCKEKVETMAEALETMGNLLIQNGKLYEELQQKYKSSLEQMNRDALAETSQFPATNLHPTN